jgi:hypothetical protein
MRFGTRFYRRVENQESEGNPMLNRLIRYFDLQSQRRRAAPQGNSAGMQPVLPQYLAVSAGVVVEPFLQKYMQSGVWHLDWQTLGARGAFGLLIGLVLLPTVYKAAFDPEKPVLVQLAALFPIGIGWQTLFSSATHITAS